MHLKLLAIYALLASPFLASAAPLGIKNTTDLNTTTATGMKRTALGKGGYTSSCWSCLLGGYQDLTDHLICACKQDNNNALVNPIFLRDCIKAVDGELHWAK